MNRLREQELGTDMTEPDDTWKARRFQSTSAASAVLATVDQRRRALEHRLELAKDRLVTDLGRLSTLVSSSAGSMRKGFVRAVVTVVAIGGLLLLGIASAVLRRRRRLRARFL